MTRIQVQMHRLDSPGYIVYLSTVLDDAQWSSIIVDGVLTNMVRLMRIFHRHGKKKFRKAAFLCMDCRQNVSALGDYMTIRDDLWKSIHPAVKGMLCKGCIEARLGRALDRGDIPSLPINYANRKIRHLVSDAQVDTRSHDTLTREDNK